MVMFLVFGDLLLVKAACLSFPITGNQLPITGWCANIASKTSGYVN